MLLETQEKRERAILAAVDTGAYSVDISLDELTELAKAADVDVVGTAVQKRQKPDPGSFMGSGRLEEIAEMATNTEADLLIFDDELTATQIRNIEKVTNIRTIDRTMLILDIFSQRAQSSEGRLQVELAQQRYMLPRLAGMGITMSRLGGGGNGGIGARRGSGETKLETDRRHIRDRIHFLEEQLEEMEKRRKDLRKRRKKNQVETVAIVGYTNVGKSTLLNHLTDSTIYAENMLFATLDPTARKRELPDGRTVVIIDTVGFVRRLPHHLVEAFKSTLEEAQEADLILNVCDGSSGEAEQQIAVAEELIRELGAEKTPMLIVVNKQDQMETVPVLGSNTVTISAKTGEGIDNLLQKMMEMLPADSKRMTLLIPYQHGQLLNQIREEGKIFSESFEDGGVLVDALVDVRYQKKVEPFLQSDATKTQEEDTI